MVMGLEEELRLVVHPYTPVHLLASVLRDFHGAFPSVRIAASFSTKKAAYESLAQGVCDLATVFELSPPGEGFRHLSCTSVELVAAASPKHPLAQWKEPIPPEPLREHMQLVVHDSLAPEDENRLRGYGVDSTEVWWVVNFEMVHSLLVSGVGWGIVPLSRMAEDLAAGRLVSLQIERWAPRKNALTIPLVVTHSAHRPLGPAGRWLLQKFAEAGGLASKISALS
jgi:DNA-binding transcriptional LysR family regulator